MCVYWTFPVRKLKNHRYGEILSFHHYDFVRLFFWDSGRHTWSFPPWMVSVAICGRFYSNPTILSLWGDFIKNCQYFVNSNYIILPDDVFSGFQHGFIEFLVLLFMIQYQLRSINGIFSLIRGHKVSKISQNRQNHAIYLRLEQTEIQWNIIWTAQIYAWIAFQTIRSKFDWF